MKKLLSISLISLLVCMLSGWSLQRLFRPSTKVQYANNQGIDANQQLPWFDGIYDTYNNKYDINVIAGQTYPSITIWSDDASQDCVKLQVINNILNVDSVAHKGKQPCRVTRIDICVSALNDIRHEGSGMLTVENLNGNGMRIVSTGRGDMILSGQHMNIQRFNITGAGNVKIRGVVTLGKIVHEGSGELNIYWIDSSQLSIYAKGSGLIQLAGIADVLHTDLYESAHLDARYLRTKNGFIATYDHAEADVWVMGNLYTLATGRSNIYYFTKPQFYTVDARTSGTVLNMGSIPLSLLNFQSQRF